MSSRLAQSVALGVYRLTFNTVFPLVGFLVLPFLLLSPKRRHTLFPRLGWQSFPQAKNHQAGPIWIHALSVGETLAALNLIKQISANLHNRPLYLSVSTFSAYALAKEKLSQDIDGLFYFPYPLDLSIRTCLDRINPALFILIETDIWPGFLAQIRHRQIPCLLINARLSPQSFSFYKKMGSLFQPAFNTFQWLYPQSQREADRFLALGVEATKIRRCGNLKFDVMENLPPVDMVKEMKASLKLPGHARVLVAGSTHSGEEVIIRNVFLRLKEQFPNLVLILAPRNPERGVEIQTLFQDDSMTVSVFSTQTPQDPSVIIVDRMGYLSRLYALADVAFVGGSLVSQGGHNPIEPACLGRPVLFGPDMRDFPDISQWLIDAGGAIQVHNEQELFLESKRLLEDPDMAKTIGSHGRQVVEMHRGTTRNIVQDILQELDSQGISLGS